ncbi:MAG: hypothetical protein JWR83_3271, partial [Aeromicrobium sp.]|nr:hypothetical protein [Aeromicrobium sp.]
MSSPSLLAILDDLAAETKDLQRLLPGLTTSEWELPTPAEGWAIRDQVSHLAFFDRAAVSAATEPEKFRADAFDLLALGSGFPDDVARRYRDVPGVDLSAWFRTARSELLDVFAGLDGKLRVPWFGPDM